MESYQRLKEVTQPFEEKLDRLGEYMSWSSEVHYPTKNSLGGWGTRGPAYKSTFQDYREAHQKGQVMGLVVSSGGIQHLPYLQGSPLPQTLYWRFIYFQPHYGILTDQPST